MHKSPARGPVGLDMRPTVLLLDGNNLAKAAFHVNGELVSEAGHRVGVAYTFLRMIERLLWEFPTAVEVMLLWDSYPCWRNQEYPLYKANRDRSKNEGNTWDEQKGIFREMIKYLGISECSAELAEADDLAFTMSRREQRLAPQVILVSNDNDWLQLVSDDVYVWRTIKKILITPSNFSKLTSYSTPQAVVEIKAVAGDKGDNIMGAERIGHETATKWYSGEEIARWREDRIDDWVGTATHQLNLELIDLSYSAGRIGEPVISRPPVNEQAFSSMCYQMEFWSILEKIQPFLNRFKILADNRSKALTAAGR